MRRVWRAAAILASLALLVGVLGYRNAVATPDVVAVTLPLTGLPAGTRLTVLLVADTHHSWFDMPASRLDAIATQGSALKPDLVLFAGDYMGGKLIDKPRVWLEDALPPLSRFHARLGSFAVSGNHDEPSWFPKVLHLQRAPKLLDNAHVDIGPVVVAGLRSSVDRPDYARAIAGADPRKPLLLLMHEPEQLLAMPPPARPVLALAGHTHGGQVMLPGIGSLGGLLLGQPACRRGLCTVNGWPVYVTSGVGTSWLPIRFGVPPELVLLTLTSPG